MKELQQNLNTGKLIIGTKRTMKKMKQSTIEKVFLADNCPLAIAQKVEEQARLNDVDVKRVQADCKELGIACKKPFFISVVSILK
ncbi:MAG: ribosomal L7Ae/L30e/S12e/Gadd45 family protein [Nanobdellota archaeon]